MKKIDKPYLYTLKAEKAGIYFIEVLLAQKSRTNYSFSKQADDEMSVQIDESKDSTKGKKQKWNGNELNNLQKP